MRNTDLLRQGGVAPFAEKNATSQNETVVLADFKVTPLYITATYDPSGEYDGASGPPPGGYAVGMYSTTQGEPAPVKVEAGQTVKITLAFDDSTKIP